MSKGGKRDNAGRKKGIPNKANAEIKEIAREYTKAAILEAAKLGGLVNSGQGKAESESARIAAINIVLERGHGKAPQAITGEGGEGPVQHAIEVTFVSAGKSDKG